jgi:hypothetical protein
MCCRSDHYFTALQLLALLDSHHTKISMKVLVRELGDLSDPVFDLLRSISPASVCVAQQYFSAPKVAMQQNGFRDQLSPTKGWPDIRTLTSTYDVNILPVLLENRQSAGMKKRKLRDDKRNEREKKKRKHGGGTVVGSVKD